MLYLFNYFCVSTAQSTQSSVCTDCLDTFLFWNSASVEQQWNQFLTEVPNFLSRTECDNFTRDLLNTVPLPNGVVENCPQRNRKGCCKNWTMCQDCLLMVFHCDWDACMVRHVNRLLFFQSLFFVINVRQYSTIT